MEAATPPRAEEEEDDAERSSAAPRAMEAATPPRAEEDVDAERSSAPEEGERRAAAALDGGADRGGDAAAERADVSAPSSGQQRTSQQDGLASALGDVGSMRTRESSHMEVPVSFETAASEAEVPREVPEDADGRASQVAEVEDNALSVDAEVAVPPCRTEDQPDPEIVAVADHTEMQACHEAEGDEAALLEVAGAAHAAGCASPPIFEAAEVDDGALPKMDETPEVSAGAPPTAAETTAQQHRTDGPPSSEEQEEKPQPSGGKLEDPPAPDAGEPQATEEQEPIALPEPPCGADEPAAPEEPQPPSRASVGVEDPEPPKGGPPPLQSPPKDVPPSKRRGSANRVASVSEGDSTPSCGGRLHTEEAKLLAPESRAPSQEKDDAAPLGELWGEKVFGRYTRAVAQYPFCVLLGYLVLLAVLVGAAWRDMELEEDFSTFVSADGAAMRNRQAYLLALAEQGDLVKARRLREAEASSSSGAAARQLGQGRRLLTEAEKVTANFIERYLTVYYVANDGNALEEDVLREQRDFEQSLRALPEWDYFCHTVGGLEVEQQLCDPGESLAALAWPSQNQVNSSAEQHYTLSFDGQGELLFQLPALFTHMEEAYRDGYGDASREPWRYLPKTFEFPSVLNDDTADMGKPFAIRTKFTFLLTFGSVLDTLTQRRDDTEQMKTDYEEFIVDKVYPLLTGAKDKYQHVSIYYEGSGIESHEIKHTLWSDILWASGSIIFVTIFMWLHMGSIVLALGGFFIIFSSIPVAYVLTPVAKTTVATFLSLFLVTVIDIDVIFVFMDFWDESVRWPRQDQRILWTMLKAGKSTLATSLTTALSFLANLASALQPLREFGLFMGLSVLAVYFLSLMFLPPLFVIREQRKKRHVKHKVVDISQGQSGDLSVDQTSRCPCPCRKKKGKATGALMSHLVRIVSRCPCCLVFLTIVCLPVFIWGIVTHIEIDTGVPDIFPKGHNQVESAAAAGEFYQVASMSDVSFWPAAQQPTRDGLICDVEAMGSKEDSLPSECLLHQCQASLEAVSTDSSIGDCWRGPTIKDGISIQNFSTTGCSKVDVVTRVAIAEASQPTASEWESVWSGVVEGIFDSTASVTVPGLTGEKALSLENWESGRTFMSSLFASTSTACLSGNSDCSAEATNCEIHTMCFFGTQKCGLEDWQALGTVQLPYSAAGARRLGVVNPETPANKRFDVTIVFGLRAARYTPLVGAWDEYWSFDPDFMPSDPWAQRAMYAMCEDARNTQDLWVLDGTAFPSEAYCWITAFKDWLEARGRRFPSREFDTELIEWYNANEQNYDDAQRNLWVVDGKLRACKFSLEVDYPWDMGADNALQYKELWDDLVDKHNAAAALTANAAWHTAQVWVTAEAEKAIVSSTGETILIECACSWCGLLVFTGDPLLACLVLSLVIINISGLAFFMTVIMQWAVGPIEVLCLVVFVGFSVTYGLHIAHNYSYINPEDPNLEKAVGKVRKWKARRQARRFRPRRNQEDAGEGDASGNTEAAAQAPLTPWEMRLARTHVAYVRVGGAVLSATVSTIGGSVFLLFCTMTIFTKLGSVIMCVTVLSVLFTMISLPAVLIVCGPSEKPCYYAPCRRMRRRGGKPQGIEGVPLVTGDAILP